MTEFIYNCERSHFHEHINYPDGVEVSEHFKSCPVSIYFNKSRDRKCVSFSEFNNVIRLHTSYFIGTDWIEGTGKAIYIEPKLNKSGLQSDYLKMLFSALKHPEVANHTDGLFEIKWDANQIQITQQQDLLTPLIIIQFLRVVQCIVRKGLKKSYYKIEENLYSRVKGKVLVSKTIKQNQFKNKPINTFCRYEEFGFNGIENRLLKKALTFVNRYLPSMKNLNSRPYTESVFHYINPAFANVSEEVTLNEVKHTKTNVFFKEYEEGISLAKLILKRFGYNISNTEKSEIQSPPFWIDMSKLFELYVLAQLIDKPENIILYGENAKGNYGVVPDFIQINEPYEKIIDTKYKKQYQAEKINFDEYLIKDIRQLSGYARDKTILSKLGKSEVDQLSYIPVCLIIYPDQSASEDLYNNPVKEISGFNNFYKQAIKLPTII